jgi:hypothetical protein
MRSSEALDPDSDLCDSELVPVDDDDEAMLAAWLERVEDHATADGKYADET